MTLALRGAVAVLAFFLLTSARTANAAGPIGAIIEKVSFDTATHCFSLSWRLDSEEIPVGCEGAFSVLCGEAAPLPGQPDNPFPVTGRSGDTTFLIDQLRFDTTYRVGMWLRIQGVWYPPDSSTLRTVAVSEASWEPVRLFNNEVDTVAVFAERVLIWRDASYGGALPPHADTVRKYAPRQFPQTGFQDVAQGFVFTNPVTLPPFYIGFRLDSSTKSSSAIGIYRDSSGHLLVEYQSVRDTTVGIIYIKTSRTDLPFVVLADTQVPRVELGTDTGDIIGSQPLDMSFTVRDNGSNCRWRLLYGNAAERPFSATAQFYGTLRDTAARISCQIPVTNTGEAGLRIHLTLDDGAHADTINISRQTTRLRCNETTTPADMILPLAPGAVLDRTGCTDALRSLFERSGGSYATDRFRLYAWQPSAPAGDWMEYSPGNAPAFTFLPGKLYWLITRDATLLDFGDGRSISLKDTLTIELPARAWTDFSSPFSFPVAFEDIMAASGESASRISCFQWQKNAAQRTWRAEPLYNGAVPGLDAPSTSLSYGTNGYFTVYNPADSPVSLRIPPVPPDKKMAKTTPTHTATPGWTMRFDFERDGSACGSVLCAASAAVASVVTVPAPPAFFGPSITADVPGASGKNGIVVLPLDGRATPAFELTVTNAAATNADVVIVPRRMAGSIPGAIIDDSISRDIGPRIPVTIGAHQSKRLVFNAAADAGNGWTAHMHHGTAAPPRILSATATRGGIALRISSGAAVNRIEIFDPTGRRRGVMRCGPLDGKTLITGVRHLTTSGVIIVRLTTRNGHPAPEHHFTKTVQVR